MNSLITIIIPTKDRLPLLKETIRSFQNQTYQNWELIIVDDNSRDNTSNWIKNLLLTEKRIKYLRNTTQISGPGICRNMGLKSAKGDYIQFFDDDDIAFPKMLEIKLHEILKTRADVVISPVKILHSWKSISSISRIKAEKILLFYYKHKIAWFVCGPLWNRKFLTEGFNIKISLHDDWEFNLKQLVKRPKVSFIEKPLSYYIKRGANTSLSSKVDEENINSEFLALELMTDLLKKTKNWGIEYEKYYKKRLYQIYVKMCVTGVTNKFNVYLKVMNNPLESSFNFKVRITIALVSFTFFNKGYKFLLIPKKN